MTDEFLLLNPGPVPVHPTVREAMAEPMVSHRSATFGDTYARAKAGLDYVFAHGAPDGSRTAADGTSLLLTGTATMGMEAAVANLVEPDDEVVALVNGKFGRRFARIADRYARVEPVEADWGAPFDLADVEAAVSDETALVTLVHSETSTGLLNPVAEVGEVAAEHDARFVVDGVSSIGGHEFRVDDWHVDVAVTDAQKALAAPPGVSALYATQRAVDAFDGEAGPFYADLDWHVRKAAMDQTPFTSAVPLVRALAVAVERIEAEGMAARIERHRTRAEAVRGATRALGLALFGEPTGPTARSNTVTAVELPAAVREDPDAFFDGLAARRVGVAGGQAHLDGRLFRMSNMGHLAPADLARGVRAVGESLAEAGHEADVDAAVEGLEAALAGESDQPATGARTD